MNKKLFKKVYKKNKKQIKIKKNKKQIKI